MSQTLCAFPWKSLYINSHEYVYPCCLAEEFFHLHAKDTTGKSLTSKSEHYFEQAFNSDFFKDMRLKMLKGEKLDSCRSCYANEAAGARSYRQHSLDVYGGDLTKYHNQTDSSGKVSPQIEMLDIKPGNLCNLHCLMCVPELSTGVEADFKKMGLRQAEGISHLGSAEMWHNIYAYSSELKRINISGGEPTINKEVEKYCDFLIQNNYQNKIHLSLISNLHLYNERMFSKLLNFKEVSLTVSVDGMNEINDFIRYPIKFEKFVENMQKIKSLFSDHESFKLLINTTCNVYNVHQISELLHFFSNQFEEIYDHNVHLIVEPNILDIKNLPQDYKSKMINLYQNKMNSDKFSGVYQTIIERLQEESNDHAWEDKFKKFHENYKKLRGMDINLAWKS